jgi:2-C-methyl-D-erythritol 4-phosphate cytidylyltransferase
MATPALVAALEDALGTSDGAVPGQPVVDTVKRVAGGVALETLRREELWAVQTPQLFRAEALRRAHDTVSPHAPAPDDAALLESAGMRVVVVDWPEENPKITVPGDLHRVRAF